MLTIPGRGGAVFSSFKQSRYNTPGRVAFLVPATLQLQAKRNKTEINIYEIQNVHIMSCQT